MEPSYSDYPGYAPDWYPEMYSSPFHRRPSPFDTRRPSPFDSVFTTPRKPAQAEQRHSPHRDINVEDPVDMRSQDCSIERKGSNSGCSANTKTVNSKPVKTEAVDDQAELSSARVSEEVPPKATDQGSKPTPEIQKINGIVEKTVELENKILSFEGARKSKQYIFIEESLVSLLLLLDNIETNGNMDIRKARKSAVCQIQQLLSDLEEKAEADKNTANEDKAEECPNDATFYDAVENVSNLENGMSEAVTPVETSSEVDDKTNIADKAEEGMTEDVSVSEDVLTDAKTKVPAEDTGSEEDNMETEVNLNSTPIEPENKIPADNAATETSVTNSDESSVCIETPSSEGEDNNMDTEANLHGTHSEPENIATEASDVDTETSSNICTEIPITDTEVVPVTEMDTSNLNSITATNAEENLPEPDKDIEAPTDVINMVDISANTVSTPTVISPSIDGSSEETVTE